MTQVNNTPDHDDNAPVWKRSPFSAEGGTTCVEILRHPDGRRSVRDSEDPDGATLTFNAASWDAFVRGVKAEVFG